MKLFYLTDTHDMGRNPGARIDDYHAAMLKKFREAVREAIAKNVDAFIHGGDWFHHPKVSNIIYNQHQRLLRKLQRADIPVYVVPGNHDLFGYSLSTLEQTSLGSLKNAGLIRLLTKDQPAVVLTEGKLKVGIYGREYDIDIDHDASIDYDIDVQSGMNANLLFSHGMLLDKPFHPDVRHTLTKDVVTSADHIFNGHYHPGYPSHKVNDTWFHNIGSTSRDEGSTGNLTRMPQYALIEINAKGVVTVNTHVYKCAAAGQDIFDRTQLTQHKQHTKHLEAFEQTIQDALAFDAFNPKDILMNTKANQNLSKSILGDALDSIVEQEKLVQDSKLDGYAVERKPVWIESVEMVNFESHKKTVVDFDGKGLNAITGPSDSGKSSIFRAIRFALHNEPKGADFIRKGTKRTTVRVTMSNGKIIERSRTKTSAGEYILHDGKGQEQEYKGFGNTIPIEVLSAHQMPKVELVTGTERSLNVSNQLDGHFLLSESPLYRASAIGRLTGVHLVDAAIREKSKDIRALTVDTNASEKRIEELNKQLEDYVFVDEEEKVLQSIKGFIMGAEAIEKKMTRLSDLNDARKEARNDIINLEIDVASYDYLDGLDALIKKAEDKNLDVDRLTAHQKALDSADKDISTSERIIASIHIDGVDEKIDTATELYRKIRNAEDSLRELESVNKEIKQLESRINQFDTTSIAAKMMQADTMLDTLTRLITLQRAYTDDMEQEAKAEHTVSKLSGELDGIVVKMEDMLDLLGNTCPLCNQEISDVRVLTHTH